MSASQSFDLHVARFAPVVRRGVLGLVLGFLPFYFYLKLVLLVWLFSPTTKGAGVVYEKVVKPFVFPLLVGSKSD